MNECKNYLKKFPLIQNEKEMVRIYLSEGKDLIDALQMIYRFREKGFYIRGIK